MEFPEFSRLTFNFIDSSRLFRGVLRFGKKSSKDVRDRGAKILPVYNPVGIMSQSILTGYIPPGNPRGLAQKHCPRGRDLTFESCPGVGNLTRAGILWKFKVKYFVRVLVLSVINTGCPKNC